jgi:hypothetical protein
VTRYADSFDIGQHKTVLTSTLLDIASKASRPSSPPHPSYSCSSHLFWYIITAVILVNNIETFCDPLHKPQVLHPPLLSNETKPQPRITRVSQPQVLDIQSRPTTSFDLIKASVYHHEDFYGIPHTLPGEPGRGFHRQNHAFWCLYRRRTCKLNSFGQVLTSWRQETGPCDSVPHVTNPFPWPLVFTTDKTRVVGARSSGANFNPTP